MTAPSLPDLSEPKSAGRVDLERRTDGIAVMTLNGPPVNALGHALRNDLARALAACRQDSLVRAVVLAGAGRSFCAGADIRELDAPREPPSLPELIATIEEMDRPVVAALHGAVVGGGLELALACHYRVAMAGERFTLPEIRLGLIPCAGGTQRLPRIIGLPEAAKMILTGEALGAERARDCSTHSARAIPPRQASSSRGPSWHAPLERGAHAIAACLRPGRWMPHLPGAP